MGDPHFTDNDRIVSFDSDELILVDEDDEEVGHLTKAACHEGAGILHRAFSLFVFNERGELLLQQRSASKSLWPLYWSNSCCSHPRRGERMEETIHRRLDEELGMRGELDFRYKFRYQARFGEVGAEREYCWVYAGVSSDFPRANRNEIADCRFVRPEQLDEELRTDADSFTPWLRPEWRRIQDDFRDRFRGLWKA